MNVDIKVESENELNKIVKTDKSHFTISLDRGRNLWSVGTSSGALPVALRGEFTTPGAASVAIKNYIDGHAERSLTYSKKKAD